jgi:hypothetical protein
MILDCQMRSRLTEKEEKFGRDTPGLGRQVKLPNAAWADKHPTGAPLAFTQHLLSLSASWITRIIH